MDQLLPVVFVVAFIAFILSKQIKHITNNLPQDSEASSNEFEKYSAFSANIQVHVRKIKTDIDSSKENENPTYVLKDKGHEKASLEKLSDFLRKLVFFETMLAKQKTNTQIEAELFGILDGLDNFIKEEIENGESLAEELKETLFSEYQNL
jgi:hypothetical protein